ncbi:MAG: dihydropteroate synthase [Flavobacteriales bacterium]|nr:dihydropteroate synthase [Flavobacteriales bacterium]
METTHYSPSFRLKGELFEFNSPKIMAIINLTPDSFYDGGVYSDLSKQLFRIEHSLKDGADFLDFGAQSTRPGAQRLSEDEELERLVPVMEAALKEFPGMKISVDTFYSKVARAAVERGAVMINDVSAGSIDVKMFETVAELKIPYVLMHMQGDPQSMQVAPHYENAPREIFQFLANKIHELRRLGLADIAIDLGFGFGKSVEHNYSLLHNLDLFKVLNCPILVGLSRKSMINKVLKTSAETALNGTTALHMLALDKGAHLLRVHDVKEAKECILLHQQLSNL